jgi:hypothetical protein
MSPWQVHVEGIGVWSPQLADFDALRAVLDGAAATPPVGRPAASVLPSNERRRAPESVLLAIEVAGQAVAMSGRRAASLSSVFASAHGDQTITDYMCSTLARQPHALSPTRFHNSVHNAPAGYWSIATGCHAASTSVCAQYASFGAALLEAISQLLVAQAPVLLVCSDTAAGPPLREVTACSQSFGSALVLAPQAGPSSLARLDVQLRCEHVVSKLPEPLAGWRAGNASAAALPLLAMLARGNGSCTVAASGRNDLQIDMESIA